MLKWWVKRGAIMFWRKNHENKESPEQLYLTFGDDESAGRRGVVGISSLRRSDGEPNKRKTKGVDRAS